MQNFTKLLALINKKLNVSPSLLKTDINRWNIRFALGLSTFTFFAGLAGSLGALFLQLLFLMIIMPIIIKKYEIITFTTDKKFLDINKEEINVDKDVPRFFVVLLSLVVGVIAIIFLLKNLHSKLLILNFCTITLTFFFIPTSFFIIKNCPIFVIFHPEFQKKYNNTNIIQIEERWWNNPAYRNVPGNIYHR